MDCGWKEDGKVLMGQETGQCPECMGINIINETSHEGLRCPSCGKYLIYWEDGYVMEGVGELICEECHDDLNRAVESINN